MVAADMVPAIQLHDVALVRKAIDRLRELGIQADAVLVSEWPSERMPSWADVRAGGIFLTMPGDRIQEGMRSLEPLFGYEPD